MKKIPRKVNQMSKEVLRETLRKKKEANDKALVIVESLLNSGVTQNMLLSSLQYISVSHFEDIVEERAISKLCGYPLCSKHLQCVPRQQYHISTKSNRVYNITDRKNFCSNWCYSAAKFLKDQIPTTPLWLRDVEDVPDFKLLPSKNLSNSLGEEVDIGQCDIKKQLVLDSILDDHGKHPEGDDSEVSDIMPSPVGTTSKEISCEVTNQAETENNPPLSTSHLAMNYDDVSRSTGVRDQTEQRDNVSRVVTDNRTDDDKSASKNNTGFSNVKPAKESENINRTKVKSSESSDHRVNLVHRIETCVYEWFTPDTSVFLFGSTARSKETAEHRSFNRLCNLIDNLELNEETEDRLQPLPDYDELKQSVDNLDIKVRAFYSGCLQFPIQSSEQPQKQAQHVPVLPLVDLHAQNALRRRIVLDRLNRVLPDLLDALGLSICNISGDVRELVNTFSLSPNNITFTPPEWNFLGLIVINLLSVRNNTLKKLLCSKEVRKFQTMILLSFHQDPHYMDRFVLWLSEMDVTNKKD